MKRSVKVTGKGDSKWAVPRHTRFSKSSAHRCEKAVETVIRRSGKKACNES